MQLIKGTLNILIIGGNGFIGSHLTELLKDHHRVTVYDRSPNKFIKEFSGVEYIYGDFNDLLLLKKAINQKDVVYHLLSTTVPLTANQDPVYDVQSNLIGTINLMELIANSDVQRLIYTSSGGTVYGNPQYLPIDEQHPRNPIGSYGIVKNTIERYIEMYAHKKNFTYLIVRPSNPYGPRQNYEGDQGLIGKIIHKGITGEEFTVWGDGSAVRDYIYIDDLAEFLKISGLSTQSGIFNIGSGKGKSINEIIGLLSEIMEEMPEIRYAEKNGFFVEKVVLDIGSITKTFGWQPKFSMEEGLSLHNQWMKSIVGKA